MGEFIHELLPIKMPLSLPLWQLARFPISRVELRSRLGEPHFVETDSSRTCGGDEDGWAFVLPSGQRILVLLHVNYHLAYIISDPPILDTALLALSSAIGNLPVEKFDQAYPII